MKGEAPAGAGVPTTAAATGCSALLFILGLAIAAFITRDSGGPVHPERLVSAPDRLQALYELLQSLGADLNFDRSIKQCLRILKGAVPFDKAGVFVRENGQYRLLHADGLPDHCLTRLSLPTESGVVAQVIETRRPVLANAPPTETPEGHVPRYLDDVRSTLAVPLIAEARCPTMPPDMRGS